MKAFQSNWAYGRKQSISDCLDRFFWSIFALILSRILEPCNFKICTHTWKSGVFLVQNCLCSSKRLTSSYCSIKGSFPPHKLRFITSHRLTCIKKLNLIRPWGCIHSSHLHPHLPPAVSKWTVHIGTGSLSKTFTLTIPQW